MDNYQQVHDNLLNLLLKNISEKDCLCVGYVLVYHLPEFKKDGRVM